MHDIKKFVDLSPERLNHDWILPCFNGYDTSAFESSLGTSSDGGVSNCGCSSFSYDHPVLRSINSLDFLILLSVRKLLMLYVPFVGCGTYVIFVASLVLFAPFSPNTLELNVVVSCFLLDDVIGFCIAILSYDIYLICSFSHMAYNMVDVVFKFVFIHFLWHFA